jgi:hypothetical protein
MCAAASSDAEPGRIGAESRIAPRIAPLTIDSVSGD